MPQIYRHNDSGNPSPVGTRRRASRTATAAKTRTAGGKAAAVKTAESEVPPAVNGGKDAAPAVPGWRRIEALKERRALKEALTDIWSEDPELDDDIFFPDTATAAAYYQQGGEDADEAGEVVIDPDDDV